MKIAKEQGSIFNKAVSLVVLFTMVCAQIPALPMPDSAANKVRGFNSDVLSYHFNRADSELSVEKWMDKARNGLLSLEASWESYALDMYDSYEDFLEAKEALKKWGEQELEKRYAQYLVKSFTGNQISNLVIDLADVTENKNKEFVYHLDDDGNILIDPETGDPIIIRPGERNIEDDIRASAENYNTVSKENIDSLQTSLETVINNQYPDLLKYVNKDNVSDFEKVFLNESQKSIAYLATESKMIRDREQQIIRQKRTGDVWSLRKKSEKEAAEIISADLIRTTEELCNEGLAALEQKTENAKAGTGELALAGEEWLREYQEQFSRGLEAWKEAEERFFIRRIEWEQEAGVQFAEGQEAWMQAFNSLAVQKEAWETKVKVLFDSGEQLFRNASLELQTAIYNARIEFEKDAEFRITAGVERAEAWVNTYITSAGIVAGAKENIGFWSMDLTDLDIPNMNDSNFDSWTANKIKDLKAAVDKYNDEKNALISSNNGYLLSIESINGKIQYLQENPYYDITTSKHDSTDSDGNKITTTKTTVHSSTDEISSLLGTIQSWQKRINDNNNNIKNIESKSKIYEKELNAAKEMQTWKILYTKYLNLALDARNALVNDFSLVMGKGALADILNENVSSEDFNLDEYQVELIRAQAVSGYWEKRLEIAKAVDEYAKELTAGRVTNVESIAAQEQAKHAYDEALANYAAAQNNLNKKGEEIEAVKIQLDQSSKKLNEINNELFNLNKDYSILFSIKQMNDNEALLYEIAGKYKELLKQNNLSKETGSKAIYIKYLEREQELGLAETIESGTKLLKNLINGDGVATKSLNEISESISAIWIPQTVDEIVDDINAYKIPEDNIYYNVIVQLLEMIFHNSTEDSEDVVDEVIEDIASTDPNNIDISDSDAVDSTDIESDIETIDSNYREMLIEAVTAAKLVLQNNYNEVIYSLRLISASSITEWYLAQTGITEIELPDNTDIKTLLEIDALQSELALREKISEYEAEGVPDYIYIVKLKDFILKNQNNASLLNAYNRTEQTSQCIIDEKSDAAKNKLKQTFADFNITYEYINEPLHQKTVTSEEDENEEIEEDKEIEEEKEIENEETDSDLGIVKRNAAATDIFPGMKATARALENMNGNFEENFALLLTSLDSAAENLLPWAKNDYAEWKQSLLQYIAAYTIYNEIEYSANINILRDKIIYLNESIANEPDNAQMYQLQKAGLNYQYALLTETENQKKDIDASTEKHWREYINKDFLFKYNKLVMTDAEKADAERADNEGVETQDKKPENKNLLLYGTSGTPLDEIEIKAALSVAEGNLADKFEAAEFATRKLNDSLLLNTSKGNFFSDFKNTVNAYLENESKLWDDADLYVTDFMYKEEVNSEYAKLQNTLFMITTLQNDIQMFGNNYEIAEDNTLLEAEMENLQTQITDKQNEYNDLLLTYEKDAKLFTEEGDVYNALYNTAKEKYKTVEDKRFEYEKQDAIRRWAATSYLDYDGLSAENSLEYKNPVEELKYSEEKYNRSQVVLQSLLDLYDKNKTERPYQDEEYNKLYNEYKITFERMLTSIKVKDKLEAEIRAEIKRNDEYYKQYSKYLAQLDAYFGVSEDDITAPAVERSAYSLKDMITINEHGMLVFNRDGFTIAGNTSEEYKALNEYFQEIERDNTETRMSSDFEVALRDLNKYLLENVNNYAKYYQWALARDYLINSFKNNNIDLLNSAFSRDTELEDGNISKMPVGFFKDVSDRRNSDEAIKLLQHQSWAALSSEEKEYLEFYTILTLQGGGGENTDGFRNATAYHEYSQIKSSANAGMIADIILGASFAAAALVAIPFVWLVLASLVLSAASFGAAAKISATVDELGRAASNYQNTIIASFGSTLTATNGMSDYLDKYQKIMR
ncbi:MAG: hypothetical protein Ta2F_04230 [Termitinemataceae bacterium]|nr:MAG: hypothetical protein Ta2F_04230 [Termitinemataceae bacterium]